MDIKDRVWRIADDLRGKERVTNRAVLKRLRKGGGPACSFGTLVPLVAEWKAETEYLARIEGEEGLPEAVQRGLIELGHLILREGHEAAHREMVARERKVECQAEFTRQGQEEFALLADRLEGEVAACREEIVRLRAALAASGPDARDALPSAPAATPSPIGSSPMTDYVVDLRDGRAKRGDADVLLADLARVVRPLLEAHGPLGAARIEHVLPDDLRKRADDLEMPLSAGWLRWWLRTFTGDGGGLVEERQRFELAWKVAGATDDAGDGAGGALEGYWARTLTEVASLLRLQAGALTAKAVMERLPSRLRHGCEWFEPLDARVLAERMAARPDLFRRVGRSGFAPVPAA